MENAEQGAQRRHRRPLASGTSSARTTTTSASDDGRDSGSTSGSALGLGMDTHLEEMLSRLPSSPKDLFKRIERQRDEIRLLQEENIRLKSREVEVSSLTLKLQQQFAATQSQVEGIKAQVHLQLSNPITEEEYARIDALPESKRDLLDTIKLGIFRQLGSMRASMQTSTRRAAELAAATSQLTDEKKNLELELAEVKATLERERDGRGERNRVEEKHASRVLELEANVRDLEAKLRNAFTDQEQFLTAKLNAQVKTDEAVRLAVRLEEAEMDTQRYKASAECCEQKLDILKSEYYELKLTYTQRILELESCLTAADEKLKTLGDLELESELFISTLAQRSRRSSSDAKGIAGEWAPGGAESGALGLTGADGGTLYESYMALPRSRKLAHALVVTKRCLHLENKVASLEHDLDYKDRQISRLQVSLEAARDALRNINSPYAMVEKTIDELFTEGERQKERIKLLEEDNRDLREKLGERTADVKVLCRHRQELLRVRKMLRKLGVAEGYCLADPPDSPMAQLPVSRHKRGDRTMRAKERHGTSTEGTSESDVRATQQRSSTEGSSSPLHPRIELSGLRALPGIEISS